MFFFHVFGYFTPGFILQILGSLNVCKHTESADFTSAEVVYMFAYYRPGIRVTSDSDVIKCKLSL